LSRINPTKQRPHNKDTEKHLSSSASEIKKR